MYKNCQVCGNLIFSQNDLGTEQDGSLNQDFCSNCYRGGYFYSRDWDGTLDDPRGPWGPMFTSRFGIGNGFGIFS